MFVLTFLEFVFFGIFVACDLVWVCVVALLFTYFSTLVVFVLTLFCLRLLFVDWFV